MTTGEGSNYGGRGDVPFFSDNPLWSLEETPVLFYAYAKSEILNDPNGVVAF
jgi:hypothetical protein